ncbi:MAG: glycosyltransferase family 4 protein [Tenuifilaceae bacterium]
MKIFFVLVLLGLLSFLLTYLIRFFALRYKLIDKPNERSLHDIPTPRLGGIAIVVSWYIGLTLFYLFNLIEKELFYALLCGVILAIVSLIDDIVEIKPYFRLIIHFATAIAAFVLLNGIRPFIIPHIEINYLYITYPLAVIGMVWFINLYNFMDGINGFASIEAITIGLVLFFFTFDYLNLVLVVAVLGFFFWNWPKAKIFMGDVGSTQLGFILITLGIYYHNNYQFSIVNWIMLSSPFWFDATFTLYRRWRNKEKLSIAHRQHAYQRIVLAGFSHMKVSFILIGINIALIIMIEVYRAYDIFKIPFYIISLVFLYYLTRLVDRRVPFK